MKPFITNDRKFFANALATMTKAAKAAAFGDYTARQVITAAPAVLDVIAASYPAIWHLEAELARRNKELDLFEGTWREHMEQSANELAGIISAMKFAYAGAGVLDTTQFVEQAA